MGDRNRRNLSLRVESLEDRLCMHASVLHAAASLGDQAQILRAGSRQGSAATRPINPKLGPLAVTGGSRGVPANVVQPLTDNIPPNATNSPVLSVDQVNRIIGQAVAAANRLGVKITVAVTDREVVSPQNPADFGNDPFRLVSIGADGMVKSRIGGVLGVFPMPNDAPVRAAPTVPPPPPAPAPPQPAAFHAIAKAAAGSFFSSNQEAFSTDTAAFI